MSRTLCAIGMIITLASHELNAEGQVVSLYRPLATSDQLTVPPIRGTGTMHRSAVADDASTHAAPRIRQVSLLAMAQASEPADLAPALESPPPATGTTSGSIAVPNASPWPWPTAVSSQPPTTIVGSPCVCNSVASAPYVPTFPYYVYKAPPPGSYYIGRGVVGQLKVYRPSQPIRNTIRFFTP